MDNPYKNRERKDIIYAVDITKDCLKYLRSKTRAKVIVLSHGISQKMFLENDNEKRLNYAEKILNKYRRAKCVVTERLHATLPCLAIGTPVLLISKKNNRMHGLRELAFNCSKEEFLRGDFEFDFDRPPENPKDYLPIRKNLINIMNDWVKSKREDM